MSERTDSAEARTDPEPSPRINRPVFYGAAAVILVVASWTIVTPEMASVAIGAVVGWLSEWFGWFYILLSAVILVFVIYLGFSRHSKTRLGPDDSRPEFGTFTWASMLFAAGIGVDLMLFAVADPVTQYLAPPRGQGQTLQAAREATVWPLFHYGISGWGMYALMGMVLAFFAYRKGLPLAIRSALYPIFGKRVEGRIGNAVDLAAVIGTIFGIAASLGIGVMLLNYGLKFLFDIQEGVAAQVGLVALAVLVTTFSAVSGVDKGIKRLSQLNVLLAIALALFVLISGNTVVLLNGLVANLGDYVSSLPGLAMETFAFERPDDWLNAWTLFFWAWWIAWAPFIGLFLARISRGRTIGQFVLGTLTFPFCYLLMWVSIFGNSAIEVVRSGDADFGQTAMNQPEHGFYALLAHYPGVMITASVATFVGLLFYVTSADSGALVMANITSRLRDPQQDARTGLRAFWAVATGLLTIGMLIMGDMSALQNATIIMALPFSFVLVLVMVGFYKALQTENAGPPAPASPVIAGHTTVWQETFAQGPDGQVAEAAVPEHDLPERNPR